MIKILDLFSGIGGFSLGLEATGHFETTCFVENDEYCRAVLRHHWPDVPVLGDICDVRKEDLPCPNPDIVVGGFPCQPFSQAGKQKADKDKRHLWPEMFRLIRECRPTWVVGENVVGFAKLGLDQALTDLENEGYATRTFNIPACAIGAPHRRQRLWIVAHAYSESESTVTFDGDAGERQLGLMAHAKRQRGRGGNAQRQDAKNAGQSPRNPGNNTEGVGPWDVEPAVGCVANGVPNRVPQLRALGNSIVPQIAEEIGRVIGEIEASHKGDLR